MWFGALLPEVCPKGELLREALAVRRRRGQRQRGGACGGEAVVCAWTLVVKASAPISAAAMSVGGCAVFTINLSVGVVC
jgi:hypothetical protein